MAGLTYKKSGVDIKGMDSLKDRLKPLVKKSFRQEVLKNIGGFGAFFRFPSKKYKDPVLVSSSDGVGTKIKIAVSSGRHETVGIDAVAMNVNDILCTGAEPLFFLDYLGFSVLPNDILLDIIKGVNRGCIEAGCSLIGGETAQMPGMYKEGEYDLAGFCVGSVERKNIIDGSRIVPQDVVIGLESNGLHSNGFSLVRRVLSEGELKRMSSELLKPTRIYVKPVLKILGPKVKGIAHITGGAFYDKIARILPEKINVNIEKDSWNVPKIFRLIQNKGSIEDKEMYHTFNMGVGMVLIVENQAAKNIMAKLSDLKVRSWIIGRAVKGNKKVEIV